MQDARSIKSLISLAKYGNKVVVCSSQEDSMSYMVCGLFDV